MKKLIFIVLIIATISCKQKEETKPKVIELSIAEKIEKANGFDYWKNVSQLNFTFNVDRDFSHFERSWIWKPKTGDVTLISGKDTISYNRKSVDSLSIKADQGFVNDKFWLLAPFQLVWDKSASISKPIKEKTQMSNVELNKITLTYPTEGGGYTPGDAYDFYYDDTFIVKEWIFRRGNATEPSMITSWDTYKDFNGLKLSTEHIKSDDNWKLYFTEISIEMD